MNKDDIVNDSIESFENKQCLKTEEVKKYDENFLNKEVLDYDDENAQNGEKRSNYDGLELDFSNNAIDDSIRNLQSFKEKEIEIDTQTENETLVENCTTAKKFPINLKIRDETEGYCGSQSNYETVKKFVSIGEENSISSSNLDIKQKLCTEDETLKSLNNLENIDDRRQPTDEENVISFNVKSSKCLEIVNNFIAHNGPINDENFNSINSYNCELSKEAKLKNYGILKNNSNGKKEIVKCDELETSKNLSNHYNWADATKENSADFFIERKKNSIGIICPMKSVFGIMSMSFLHNTPYKYTLATMTHYITDICDKDNDWLLNLDLNVQSLNITNLYFLGTRQRSLVYKYVRSAKLEVLEPKYKIPSKNEVHPLCSVCFKYGCSSLKATNILQYNFGYEFKIPCK